MHAAAQFFDIPVFWPILLMYWFILLFVTMKRQVKHMIKHRYLPFSWGKQASPQNSMHAGDLHAARRCPA